MKFRLAHLSDPHLGPLPRPPLRSLLSKRIFGYINYVRHRQSDLSEAIVASLCADLAQHRPDHIAVTGDLVNIALDEEFAEAAAWLEGLGEPDEVTVVLGNHDGYVPGAARRAAQAFAPFLTSDDGRRDFPVVRVRGEVALIGVSTALATLPGVAAGRLGADQRMALGHALDRHDHRTKVVLIHHPPDPALASGLRGLADVTAVRTILAEGCADLVLHGHNHTATVAQLATARGGAAIVGVPSASSDGSRYPLAGYALYDIDTDAKTIQLTRRGLERRDGPVVTLSRVALAAGGDPSRGRYEAGFHPAVAGRGQALKRGTRRGGSR